MKHLLARWLYGAKARRAFDAAVRDLESMSLPEAVTLRTLLPHADRAISLRLRFFHRALVGVGDRLEPGRSCLPRALALFGEARKHGLDVRLAVGVRTEGADLASHAWLTLDGRPFLESLETAQRYRTIALLPLDA